MLVVVKSMDRDTIQRLLSIYSESMECMESCFDSKKEMIEAYSSFLNKFVANPKQLIMVEEINHIWVSGLRAIETKTGKWFIEAVETKPEERGKGYGKELIRHTINYLSHNGMKEVSCTIGEKNVKSKHLHQGCGFISTKEIPMNPWGEVEEGRILYKLKIQ